MIATELLEKYQPTIGIECHVQLKTETKLFSGVSNDARGAKPNTLVSPICFGMPGTLPVLNKRAVELGIKAGIALNAQIAGVMKFDRKHYFYPDLPKGYQITQFDQPIVGEGYVEVPVGESEMLKVRIERAHLEEDAGKSTHPTGAKYTLVDLNRAGTPLLEIVSFPDMHSPIEARMYAQELYNLMKYAQVSDVDLFHGNMRFDVNVSVAPVNSKELGTRAEVKNLNSFRSVERATEFEIKRQVELLEKEEFVVQETRGWNEAKQKTISQRTKEQAHDYRYFPEPDLPPFRISEAEVEKTKVAMPLLPAQLRKQFTRAGISRGNSETLIAQPYLAQIVSSMVQKDASVNVIKIVNWLVVDVMAEVNSREDFDWDNVKLSPKILQELESLVSEGKLSSNGATTVLKTVMYNGEMPTTTAEKLKLLQVSDASSIEKIVDDVIAENEKAAADVRSGEARAVGFLVGQVMQKSKGQANPQMAKDLLIKKLS